MVAKSFNEEILTNLAPRYSFGKTWVFFSFLGQLIINNPVAAATENHPMFLFRNNEKLNYQKKLNLEYEHEISDQMG